MDLHDNRQRAATFRTDEEVLRFLNEWNDYLGPFENRLSAGIPASNHPIVLIGGLQRSGTTLLYQLLARYGDVGYINNLMARFWRAPCIGAYLSQHVFHVAPAREQPLSSNYGVTEGLDGPHEFGYFWTEWLRLEHTLSHRLTDEEVGAVDWAGLANCLRQIAGVFGKPLVLKNPIACWNAPRLAPYLPELRLVLVERDLFYVIQSTYLARKKRYGDADHWWSLKPPSFADIIRDPDPLRQVVRQVVDSQAVLDALPRIFPGTCASVNYQQLRTSPAHAIRCLADRCGFELHADMELPQASSFPDGDKRNVTPEEERTIRALLEAYRTPRVAKVA